MATLKSWWQAIDWAALQARLPQSWLDLLAQGWAQWLDWLPPAWRRHLQPVTSRVLLVPQQGGWQLLAGDSLQVLWQGEANLDPVLQSRQLQQAVQAQQGRPQRLLLMLPETAALQRVLTLPVAARSALARIVPFEIDRQTPFQVGQVYYASRERRPAGASSSLQLQLAVAPRAQVDVWLQQLRAAGLAVDGIDLLQDGRPCGFNLLPKAQRPRPVSPQRQRHRRLAVAVLLLLLLDLGWSQHRRSLRLEAMQTEVAAQRQQLGRLQQIQQQWQDGQHAAEFLLRRKQHGLTVLTVLNELSQRLPDDVSLQRLSIDASGQLSFMGLAPQAGPLVGRLKASPWLGQPGLQGSIVRDPLSGKERFAMSSQLPQSGAGQ